MPPPPPPNYKSELIYARDNLSCINYSALIIAKLDRGTNFAKNFKMNVVGGRGQKIC